MKKPKHEELRYKMETNLKPETFRDLTGTFKTLQEKQEHLKEKESSLASAKSIVSEAKKEIRGLEKYIYETLGLVSGCKFYPLFDEPGQVEIEEKTDTTSLIAEGIKTIVEEAANGTAKRDPDAIDVFAGYRIKRVRPNGDCEIQQGEDQIRILSKSNATFALNLLGKDQLSDLTSEDLKRLFQNQAIHFFPEAEKAPNGNGRGRKPRVHSPEQEGKLQAQEVAKIRKVPTAAKSAV